MKSPLVALIPSPGGVNESHKGTGLGVRILRLALRRIAAYFRPGSSPRNIRRPIMRKQAAETLSTMERCVHNAK